MRKRKPWETGPVEPRRTRPPSSSTPGPRSWSRREGRPQNSPRRLGHGDRRLPTHDRRADARGSGRQHWICEHHVACPPGVGKTHLAISLAITAAESGRKIYFGSLTDLVDSLEEAKAAGRLDRRLKTLTYPALLVVDEIGYLPVTQSGAILFFQLVNRRYGRASTVLTSNKGFEEWGRILGDEVMAAALLDRVLHRCHIVNIRGNSYRMRRHAELSRAIHPSANRRHTEHPASREPAS